MEGMINVYNILVGKPGGNRQLGRRRRRWETILEWIFGYNGDRLLNTCILLNLDGKITLECILGKLDGRCGMDSSGSGYGPVAGPCEHGNDTIRFHKRRGI
jgi:hypothetical protein